MFKHYWRDVVGAKSFCVLAALDGLGSLGGSDVDGGVIGLLPDVSEDPPELFWLGGCSWGELGVKFVGDFVAVQVFFGI